MNTKYTIKSCYKRIEESITIKINFLKVVMKYQEKYKIKIRNIYTF